MARKKEDSHHGGPTLKKKKKAKATLVHVSREISFQGKVHNCLCSCQSTLSSAVGKYRTEKSSFSKQLMKKLNVSRFP